jgi:RNA recognition motif-containing protein
LWVSNLSPTCTEEKIKYEFSRIARVQQIHYKRSCNTAFLDFSESQEAEKAKTILQGKIFEGYPLKIDFGKVNLWVTRYLYLA